MKVEISDLTRVPTPRSLRAYLTEPTSFVHDIRYYRRWSRIRYERKYFNKDDKPLTCTPQFLDALRTINDKVSAKVFLAVRNINYRKAGFNDNSLHIEQDGNVSFLPKTEASAYPNWQLTGRIKMRPGRFVRRILRPWATRDISDNELNSFATAFKLQAMKANLVIDTMPVAKAYSYSPYSHHVCSCMHHKPVAEFYSEIGVMDCITVVSNGELIGRALLWENDLLIPGCRGFVDRIYGDVYVQLAIKQWAKDNRFAYKAEQNADCTELVLPDGTVRDIDFMWRAELPTWTFIPFLDTMCVYSKRLRAFSCRGFFGYGDNDFYLTNTDGKL